MTHESNNQNDVKLGESLRSEDQEKLLKGLSSVKSMEVPFSLLDPTSYKRFSLYQLIYSIFGLVLGLLCIVGGIVLFLNGVTGSTSWTTKCSEPRAIYQTQPPELYSLLLDCLLFLLLDSVSRLRSEECHSTSPTCNFSRNPGRSGGARLLFHIALVSAEFVVR